MKILFILPRYHTNLNNWINKLLEEGDEVKVVLYHKLRRNKNCPVPPVLIEYASWYNRLKRILRIKCADSRCGVPNLGQLKGVLKECSPDLIIIRDPARVFSVCSIIIARVLKMRILFYTQAPLYTRYSFVKKTLIELALCAARACMVTPVKGVGTKKRIKSFFYLPFVMKSNFTPEYKQSGSLNSILMVGKYIPRKNHILLIQAVSMLPSDMQVKLTIIGSKIGVKAEGYYQQVKEYIEKNSLEQRITLRDPLSYEDLQREYEQHDLFVLPSRDEEVGVTVLEAMSRGLPVICSNTAGASDFIRDYKNGIIFKSDNSQSLTSALVYILSDRARRSRMAQASIRIVANYYDPDNFYRRLKILKDSFYA